MGGENGVCVRERERERESIYMVTSGLIPTCSIISDTSRACVHMCVYLCV